MKRYACSLALLGLLAPAVLAQPAPTTTPPPPVDDDDQPNVDRPMGRALAYERRDVVEELLTRPGSFSTATAVELAEDLGIPKAHADKLVAAAKTGSLPTDAKHLIELGVPAGRTLPGEAGKVTLAQLEAAGWSQQEAKEFLRFRRSAERTHRHFREIEATREARANGARLATEHLRTLARGTMADRVRAVSEVLGVRAVELTPEAESARERARLASAEAGSGRDPLSTFRRADGTLDIGKMVKSQTFAGAAGVTHFAFALFLKELALVLHTGDSGRLEQFVDGLLSTDFFVNYGLFATGAAAADAAYGAYVRRVTRKHFLSGVLRSNLVLAAGLAVPMVARGQFDADTYIVDVTALGLSATAVKAAVEGMKGVWRLARGGRAAINLGRLAGPAGWVWTAGETAVVLLIGDALAHRLDKWMDDRELRGRVRDSGKLLQDLVARHRRGEPVTPEEMMRAVAGLQASYDDLRRHKAAPMEATLAAFHGELEKAAKDAVATDNAASALENRLAANPLVREHVERTGYTDRMRETREAAREADLRSDSAAFERAWGETVENSYVGGGVTPEDPAPRPDSRLGLYDEETDALLRALDATTDPEARAHIARAIERVRVKRAMDRAVYRAGTTSAAPSSPTTGMTGAVTPGQ